MRTVRVRSVIAENLRRVDEGGVTIVLEPAAGQDTAADSQALYDALYWALPSTTFEALYDLFTDNPNRRPNREG